MKTKHTVNWLIAFAILLGALAIPTAVFAQEEAPQEEREPEESKDPTAAERFQDRIDELKLDDGEVCDQFEVLREVFQTAITNEDLKNAQKRKIRSLASNEAFKLVDRCDDGALNVEILNWIVGQNSRNRKARKAIAMIESDYLDQPGIGDAFGKETELDVLLKLITENPDENTVAVARFLKAMKDSDEEQKENQLRSLTDSHGDVLYRGQPLSSHIAKPLADLRFRVGKIAPNIVGPDTDNVEFALEDYRGKVVVLDFWGDW